MYVIVDLEWFGAGRHMRVAAQLAAMRVDDSWKSVSVYSTLIRPPENVVVPWEHSCFNGGRRADFMEAPTAYTALNNFLRWLHEDDTICIWNDQSADTLKKLINIILKLEIAQKMVILEPYICAYAKVPNGNPQAMARRERISTPPLNHWAMNDVEVARRLLEHLKFPPQLLQEPLSVVQAGGMRYLYDKTAGLVHSPGGECIRNFTAQGGTNKIQKCISKGYRPCPVCCKESWRHDIREMNTAIIQKTGVSYFFFHDSAVFHRASCHLILNTRRSFLSATYYESCIKKGLVPCKLCKPVPGLLPLEIAPVIPKEPVVIEESIKQSYKTRVLDESEKRAMARYKQATEERNALVLANMTDEERQDTLTLTSWEYVFWAAKGYRNFHLHNCSKLKGLNRFIGFSVYEDAIRSGYLPCRECKPTSKHSLDITVHAHTKMREDETMDVILALCDQKALRYTYRDPFLYIVTDQAEWEIETGVTPIVLMHKPDNTDEFHRQPKMFLSVSDAINYIVKHDSKPTNSVYNLLNEQRRKNKGWKN